MKNIINSTYKIILIFLIIQIIFSLESISKAFTLSDIINSADDFLSDGRKSATDGSITTTDSNGVTTTISTPNDKDTKEIVEELYSLLLAVGVAITVIIGGVLGIKYMLSSVENKAKIKESFVPYVIGCIAIYGALGIWKLAITIFSNIA